MPYTFSVSDEEATLWGRMLRLGVVRDQLRQCHITEAQALDVLAGNLTPDDSSTKQDDSSLLHATNDELRAAGMPIKEA